MPTLPSGPPVNPFPRQPQVPAAQVNGVSMFKNVADHPKTSLAGLLIAVTTVAGVLSQQGVTMGHAGTGTVVSLIAALATAMLGLVAKDPNATVPCGVAVAEENPTQPVSPAQSKLQ